MCTEGGFCIANRMSWDFFNPLPLPAIKGIEEIRGSRSWMEVACGKSVPLGTLEMRYLYQVLPGYVATKK